MKRPVVKVTQSPLNALRWSLDFECGHELWITARRRPTRKTADCLRCDVERPGKEAGG